MRVLLFGPGFVEGLKIINCLNSFCTSDMESRLMGPISALCTSSFYDFHVIRGFPLQHSQKVPRVLYGMLKAEPSSHSASSLISSQSLSLLSFDDLLVTFWCASTISHHFPWWSLWAGPFEALSIRVVEAKVLALADACHSCETYRRCGQRDISLYYRCHSCCYYLYIHIYIYIIYIHTSHVQVHGISNPTL